MGSVGEIGILAFPDHRRGRGDQHGEGQQGEKFEMFPHIPIRTDVALLTIGSGLEGLPMLNSKTHVKMQIFILIYIQSFILKCAGAARVLLIAVRPYVWEELNFAVFTLPR